MDGLKDGLETVYGTKGTYFSGGEAQRLVIARAFLKDAEYVILDEATAFADPENERIIQESFKKLAENKTTLLIAHRLSTVVNADKILVNQKRGVLQKKENTKRIFRKKRNIQVALGRIPEICQLEDWR